MKDETVELEAQRIGKDHPLGDLRHYLRRTLAAEYIGVSVRELDRLRFAGEIPFYQLGRRLVVFHTNDLEAFMATRRVDVSA